MNWAREFMGTALLVTASVAVIVPVEWWARRTRLQPEVTRKLMHLAGVLPCLFVPVLIHSTAVAVGLAAALAIGLWAGDRFGCLRSVSEVARHSHGAMYYPLAILTAFILAGDRPWMFLSALLAVGVADALAALVGSTYGRLRYEVAGGETKSLEGSAVFFGITFAAVALPLLLMVGLPWPTCLLAALLTSMLATGVEAVSLRGLDNLLVPAVVCITLDRVVGIPWQHLLATNLVLLGLLTGVGAVVGLTRHPSPAAAIIFVLITYAVSALADWPWALAPVSGFVLYVTVRTRAPQVKAGPLVDDGFHQVPVWDRRHGEARTEPVYRAGTLRFLFRNPLGRLAMRTLLSTKPFNNLITRRQRSPRSRSEIMPFIERHRIDVAEFVQPVSSFTSFADFFIRELRPETRPIAAAKDAIVAPCDGRIQWLASPLAGNPTFQVKGETYSLERLAGDQKLAAAFAGGTLLGIYLSPFDYHRFCYPADGGLLTRCRLGSRYLSVNAGSLAAGFRAFDCNVRQATVLTRGHDCWAMVEVAGFYAGGIVNLDPGGPVKTKGLMKGYFRLGGSFIVLAFQAGAVRLDPDIVETLAAGTEVRVRLGEKIGVFNPPTTPS